MYSHGRGLPGFVPDPWTVGPLVVADGVLWVWALNATRISVALLLLRLKDSTPWRVTLWAIVGVQACMLVVGTTMHLVMCRPISARWAPTPDATCIPAPKFMVYGYVYSGELLAPWWTSLDGRCCDVEWPPVADAISNPYKAFTIASDLILSLLPVTFIRTLRRPLHEKALIACLMGAGMAATGIAIARLFLIMGFLGKGATATMNAKQDILWGMELTIGVLTASIPPLKAPVQRVLLSWGVLSSDPGTDVSFVNTPPDEDEVRVVIHQMGQWSPMVRGRASESQEGLREGEAAKLGAAEPSGFRIQSL